MREGNARGVQEIATQRRQSLLANALFARRAVDGVTNDWTTERGEMDADLVRASRVNVGGDKGEITDMSESSPIGTGFAALAAASSHARAAVKIAGDGKFDTARIALRLAVEKSEVLFLDKAIAEGGGKLGVRCVCAGDDDGARGVFVEAMNDAGTQRTADGGETVGGVREVMQERGDECVRFGTDAGMDDHRRRLVDYGEVGVFVKNLERDRLGLDAAGWRGRKADGDRFAERDAVRRLFRGAVDENVAIFHERLNAIAAEFGQLRGKETIEALASVFSGD
jgi:hypothetical protein